MPNINLTAAPQTDYASQLAQLQYQQQIAQALSQAGAQDIPVSSAGGISAPISPLAALSKALNSGVGSYLGARSQKGQAALSQQERQAAIKALASFGQNPDTTGVIPGQTTASQQINVQAPSIGGTQGPSATGTMDMPQPSASVGTIPGGPASYAQRQQQANQMLLSDNPYLSQIAPQLMAQSKPQYVPGSQFGTNAIDPMTGKVTQAIPGSGPLPSEAERKAIDLYGPGYKTDPRYLEQIKREALGVKSSEAQAQAVQQAGAMAGARATGAQGTVNTEDPINQSWMKAVLSGNATMQQVPASRRDSVSMGLSDAPKAAYSPLASSRLTMAANRIVGNYIKLPQYDLTANGLPYLQRIDAALKTPGSVSDQDLLDSLTKLNTAGNAVTDAQVKLITDGKSYSDWAGTIANKFKNGGVLSEKQRTQIKEIANNIYANYKKGYQPVYEQATKQLQAAGIPEAFWTIPDLNKLNAENGAAATTPASAPAPTSANIAPAGTKATGPGGKVLVSDGKGGWQ